jgi:hypothetical protein
MILKILKYIDFLKLKFIFKFMCIYFFIIFGLKQKKYIRVRFIIINKNLEY